MKNLTNSIPNLRVFKVKYISPTNARGSRVEIKETKRYSDQKDDKVTLSYDYQIGDVLEQALQYLDGKGFEIVARGSEYSHYYVLVNSWGENFKDLKGNKVY